MQKYIKTGLLIIVLVVPVLIFLFLQGYTTNHFDLPYYVPLRDSVTNDVIVNNGDTAYYQLEDFSLASIDSQSTVTSEQLRNRVTVVSAFNGSCEGECEKVWNHLIRIRSLHETLPSLTVLTILATRDTTFVRKIADRPKSGWLVAHVAENTYSRALRSIFHLDTLDNAQTISGYKPLSLVDSKGFIRGYYDPQKDEEIERLLAEIRVLEYNRKTEQK